jgi:hypothetical protein
MNALTRFAPAARRHAHWLVFGAACVVFVLSWWPQVLRSHQGVNLHALHALAWVNGQVDVDYRWMRGVAGDWAIHNGRWYVAFPPAPAVLAWPVVAILGEERTNTTLIAVLCIALSAWALNAALRRLEVTPSARMWSLSAYLFGTGVWHIALESRNVWHYAHAVALMATALCLNEALGRRRGALLGLYVAAALLSRQLALFLIPTVLVMTHGLRIDTTGRRDWRGLLAFFGVIALCAGAFGAYNVYRFGNPFESGYTYMLDNGFLLERARIYGRFSPVYIPFNLYYLLIHGPNLLWDPSTNYLAYPRVDFFGTSLLGASAFLITVFAARFPRPVTAGLWLGIVMTVGTQMLYLGNGSAQINTQRFVLDVMPHLILLMGAGLQQRFGEWDGRVWRAAIVYSISLNALWLAGLDLFNRALLWWYGLWQL